MNLKILKHCLGEKTARIPRRQNMLNIEPIIGFLPGKSVVTVGGKTVRNTMRSKPSKDTNS